MKKNYLIISIIAVILAVIFLLMSLPPHEPERLNNIPVTAVWHGGADGGWWYDLVSVNDSIYRFRIYNESSGDLISDSDFLAEGECMRVIKEEGNVHNLISYYSGNIILAAKDKKGYTLKKINTYKDFHHK